MPTYHVREGNISDLPLTEDPLCKLIPRKLCPAIEQNDSDCIASYQLMHRIEELECWHLRSLRSLHCFVVKCAKFKSTWAENPPLHSKQGINKAFHARSKRYNRARGKTLDESNYTQTIAGSLRKVVENLHNTPRTPSSPND